MTYWRRQLSRGAKPRGSGDSARKTDVTQRVSELLGGFQVLHRRVNNPLDAHRLLLAGLPAAALIHLGAEILAEVFGSQAEAEAWMERPAIGLEQHRPIDLLTTPAGAELVGDFLHRLEFGVYT